MEIDKLNYEQAIIELESILEQLDNGECSLEESLEKYKTGIKLYNHCNKILTKAEGEIKMVLQDEDESLGQLDFIKEVEENY